MKNNNVVNFIKKNLSYIVVALCILAVGLSVIFVMASQAQTDYKPVSGKVEPTEPAEQPPAEETVNFILPVKDYSDVETYAETMSYKSTLKRFSAHLATDFYAAEGTPVYAVYGGTVESVENSLLKGFTVVIDHGNGLKTVYNSLEDADEVEKGDKVNKGDLIGRVSSTNRQESKQAHLHFEVLENGASINPNKYLTIDEK